MTRCSHFTLQYKSDIILPGALIHLGEEGRGMFMELSQLSMNMVKTDKILVETFS